MRGVRVRECKRMPEVENKQAFGAARQRVRRLGTAGMRLSHCRTGVRTDASILHSTVDGVNNEPKNFSYAVTQVRKGGNRGCVSPRAIEEAPPPSTTLLLMSQSSQTQIIGRYNFHPGSGRRSLV